MNPPARIQLVLDSVVPPVERDWLAAIQRSGTRVTWDSPGLVPMGVSLASVADPAGASELSIAAPIKSVMVLHDAVGPIDSVTVGDGGARVELPGIENRIGVSFGKSTASAAMRDSVVFKRLLVEGSAGWETKFTIAALTERGWKVDALTHVAPGVDVREGNPVSPDTARYAAVIAIDSTAALISHGAASFVRNGGGLVALHDASGIGPHTGTSVVLERKAGGKVVASRSGAGRVVRIGYKDLWRNRMSDDDSTTDPAATHRAWLAAIVSAVAYAPRVAITPAVDADPAPLADMVDRIGARTTSRNEVPSPFRSEVPSSVLFGVLLISLLLELASRRLRGAR
jgi:hypothetical protein